MHLIKQLSDWGEGGVHLIKYLTGGEGGVCISLIKQLTGEIRGGVECFL